jgi:ribosomal protein S18 acetylase RimI-like enzyme
MQLDDLPAVFAVRVSTAENALTMEQLERDYGVTPQSLAEGMKSDLKGWVCEEAGAVVGFAIGDRSTGEVHVVAVRPEYEARGIGKNLLSHVQTWLFSEGRQLIWLLANPDQRTRAHGFYRHLGWRPTGTLKGNDEVMTLQLARTAFDEVGL